MARGAKRGAKVEAKRQVARTPARKGTPGDRQLARRLAEALEQQAATGEILRVISNSPSDAQPVFDAIVASASRLCQAEFSAVARFEDGLLHLAALNNLSPAEAEAFHSLFPRPPLRNFVMGRAFVDGQPVHFDDVLAELDYDARTREVLQRVARYRTSLGVPILRDGVSIGVILCARRVVKPFTETQIELVKTFADQAVIAIENVRLFTEVQARNGELAKALEREAAAAEVLGIVSRSPADVQPVFDAIARSAARLCEGDRADLFRFDGGLIHHVTMLEASAAASEEFLRIYPRPADRDSVPGWAILDRAVVHIPDVEGDPSLSPSMLHRIRLLGIRALVVMPMLRDGEPLGAIGVTRGRPRPFSHAQIALLKTFADQAVIAMENARRLDEVQARNRELTATLEQQMATSEILRIISRSPTDVRPVFDTIVRNARALCVADSAVVFTYDGEMVHLESLDNADPEQAGALRDSYPIPANRGHATGRAILTGRSVHIPDVRNDPEYALEALRDTAELRTVLSVPMVRDGLPMGAISVQRWATPRPFSDQQVALLQTFADQAVIAVENGRLFKELQARNRDLSETLEQQTATGEVLKAISRSTFDLEPVLQTLIENATRLCGATRGHIFRLDGELLRYAASHGATLEFVDWLKHNAVPLGSGSVAGRAASERRTVHIHDVLAEPGYEMLALQRLQDYRTALGVPMLREDVVVGVIVVLKTEVAPFTPRSIELVTTFADQAVIAIENARLLQELRARTGELGRSVDELTALGEVSRAVSSTLDLETVLDTIAERAVELSASDGGLIYEFDEGRQEFVIRGSHHLDEELGAVIRQAPIRLGEGVAGRAAARREPVQIPDVLEEAAYNVPRIRTVLARRGYRALLSVPLLSEERIIGVLTVWRQAPGHFDPAVVRLLQTFAAQSVLAIHNARLFREIRRQKQYADALLEASPVAIVTIDLDGVVVGWNPGAERLFGYTPAEAMGRALDGLVATEEIRDAVRTRIQQSLKGERVHDITRRARKDGVLMDVEVAAVPVVVDGAGVGIIAIYHDITELLRARREAEAANEAKGAFLATMSHEIRTPMNAVIGMSGLLLNTPLTAEQREYAEVVRQSGDTLLTVINDILDFSKIEAGQLELEFQPFDLRECVESALDLVATRAAEKGLDLAYLIGEGTPAGIVGDVTRLRQVLLNLLSNAVKFTERGEVVLAVSARPPDGGDRLHELTFAVRDTGIGIPPDRLGRLFRSFSQVDASTTRRYGGTGLGLAISRRLTELMGGGIDVTSEVGGGSEFRVTIRAAAAAPPLSARRDLSGEQPSLRGKRVLVVDDNATNRRILTAQLDAWGMAAQATGSPREALGWIRAGAPFDAGILDMHMPEMDGVALAHTIREHRSAAELPLVLFSSLGRREARAGEGGFAAYLNKPIKPSQLFDALVSVLAEQPVHVRERTVARRDLDPDMARRHPLRILLAEDNIVNQKVALRLLGQMGYRADVAANGLEAIEAVDRQVYDVVLMDVQMPELDGFEASREIGRRGQGERPRIVAMTANVMQGDRELCEAAGMDDYVAKPIRMEELVAALERCRRRPDGGARMGGAAPVRAPASAAIDRAVFEGLTAAMGDAFVAELVDTFVADGRELVAALGRALDQADLDTFRRAAHSLKSNGETLGATGLAALARELEAMARAGSLAGASQRLGPLAAAHETAAQALGELRRGLSA
jgi:PAS domain S-box-containing protein